MLAYPLTRVGERGAGHVVTVPGGNDESFDCYRKWAEEHWHRVLL